MTDRPRPPRPDKEDLDRFHNGDTLDNIPVVRLPEQPHHTPSPFGLRSWTLGLAAVAVATVGALAAVGALQLAQGEAPTRPVAEASSPDAREVVSSQPAPTPSAAESPEITRASTPEQVRIIQAPVTGGDISTTYCLVYTGSDSGGVREAILLANAPAHQCADLLSYDPVIGSLYESVPTCEPPARTAMLVFDASSSWGNALYFTCLAQHTGA